MKDFTVNEFISAYGPIMDRIISSGNINAKSIKETLDKNKEYFQNIHRYHSQHSKFVELYDFYILCKQLRSHLNTLNANHDIGGFFLNTDMKIMPDFDVLRFSNKNIINIDLKHQQSSNFTKQKLSIINKFKKQNHILKVISDKYSKGKPKTYNIVFFSTEQKIMLFDIKLNELKPLSIKSLISLFTNSIPSITNKIFLLEPSDYIISPSNNFSQYITGEYWLTPKQQKATNNILKNNGIFGVSGCAGSGKSLIAYDLIRKLNRTSKKILFIFCGHEEKVHTIMDNHFPNAKFIQTSELNKNKSILNNYDYIFIDEAQKIYHPSLHNLMVFANNNHIHKTICFFYDLNQRLERKDDWRLLNDFINTAQKDNKGKHYHLKSSIRSNPTITAFIDTIMDKSKNNLMTISMEKLNKYVDIKYYDTAMDAYPYITYLRYHKGYTFLTPTNDDYHKASVDKFSNFPDVDDSNNSHSNIGYEYNKVVTYADENLTYNNSNLLQQKFTDNEYYYLGNELYVNMSRAISNLSLIIIGNKPLYKEILHIIYRNRDEYHKLLLLYQRLNPKKRKILINNVIPKLTNFRI